MNFYKELAKILQISKPAEKIEHFEQFYALYKTQQLSFESEDEVICFTTPSYAKFCQVVAPQDVVKRKNLTTKQGQINLLHAIAHIEYSAIDLALDAAYRFRGLPKQYYDDWLVVADDEVRHFMMIEKLLEELGANYGDVTVHNALFEASQKTQHSFLERMAVVPRYLEANGLDATPMILEKLQKLPSDEMIKKIISSLKIILDEEIDHVKKGDIWFEYACKEQNIDREVYFEIIKKYYPRGFLRPDDLNIEARREAGFSCSELKIMAQKDVCHE